MAGYNDTRNLIIEALMGRQAGTEIQPENHQAYALNMLDYVRSVELVSSSTLVGLAEENTVPVQPNKGKVCYIAGVSQDRTVTFSNFIDNEGNPISITTGEMEGVFVILLWNMRHWVAYTFNTNIISSAESANFYYGYNIRKTYASVAAMNADSVNPIGTDGCLIKIGELVTVVNSTTPAENGYYSYEGSENGWLLQSGFSFEIVQTTGTDINKTMSQKAVTDELALKASHGYASSPKTLKQVNDNLVQLAGESVAISEYVVKSHGIAKSEEGFEITDEQGNVCLFIDKNGKVSFGELSTTNINNIPLADILTLMSEKVVYDGGQIVGTSDSAFQISDPAGNVLVDVSQNGSIYTANEGAVLAADVSAMDGYDDYNHILIYGQSLAAASYSGPVVTTEQRYPNLLRFIGGVRTIDAGRIVKAARAAYVERLGAPQYGEMIDYANKLSVEDGVIMDYKYSELVPLTEREAFYKLLLPEDKLAIFVKDEEVYSGTKYTPSTMDGETPVSGLLEGINNLFEKENGLPISSIDNINFIGSCPSFGSAVFSNLLPLDKGGTLQTPSLTPDSITGASNYNYFEVLMSDIHFAKKICDELGKTYSVKAIAYYHEGTNYMQYGVKFGARELLQLFTLINDRVKLLTGQQNDIIFVLHQSSLSSRMGQVELFCGMGTSPTIYDDITPVASLGNVTEKAFTDAMPNADIIEYDKNNVILGQPIYGFEYATDFTHLSSKGSKMHGMAMGVALKHHNEKESGKWMPIHPLSHTYRQFVSGDITYYELRLKFSLEYAPLVLDENAIHGTQENANVISRGDKYGFLFADSTGALVGKNINDTDFIDSVEVVRGDTVRIVTKTDITNYSLHYALDYVPKVGGTDPRPWGNLRDSRRDALKFKLSEEMGVVGIDNYCPSFDYKITI